MSSRTPPRPRTGGRAPLPVRSAPKSNPMPLILGGVGLLVVVILLVVMSQSGKKPAPPPTPTPAAQPKAPHQSAPTQVAAGAAKAGKTPTKPAPALTPETLQKAAQLLDVAKGLFNEGSKLRTGAGDNTGARAKMSEAKDKIDEIKALLAAPLRWQEEADLEDWAMPAAYSSLGSIYNEISSLEKKVRMNGGT